MLDRRTVLKTLAAAAALLGNAAAQPPGRGGPPLVTSPEVAADRKVTFRLLAPKATAVRLGGDLPNAGGATFKKAENGVWEATTAPVAPGAYRYSFNIDGVNTLDPRNPLASESNSNASSLLHVPGAAFMDDADVPHGAVAAVPYWSKALGKMRRLHVYTPPGYEKNAEQYPVFYLLHGASDSDQSWSTVGRAGIILDNLIAAGKAKPMVVAMPCGHTEQFTWGRPLPGVTEGKPAADPFMEDFAKDLAPLIESRYRLIADRNSRAVAGLSMGGMQTLNIAAGNLDRYGYVGVYSSGVFGIAGGFGPKGKAEPNKSWEEQHRKTLEDAELKKGLKLFWFGTGKKDFLLETTRGTVKMLKGHGFDVVYEETEGDHSWPVWREYLRDFAPKLFR